MRFFLDGGDPAVGGGPSRFKRGTPASAGLLEGLSVDGVEEDVGDGLPPLSIATAGVGNSWDVSTKEKVVEAYLLGS